MGPVLSITQIFDAYWPIVVCSFLISLIGTPLCRGFARRHNIVDRPDDRLKPHKRPVPYLGGLAIFAGWSGGLLLALAMFGSAERVDPLPASTSIPAAANLNNLQSTTDEMPPSRGTSAPNVAGPGFKTRNTVGILLGGALATLLGLLDDLRAMSPGRKMLGLTLAAIVLFATGVGDESIRVFFRICSLDVSLPRWWILALSLPIVWFFVVGACNATNLIDGMDGLCSGVLAIMGGGFLVLAVHMHSYSHWDVMDVQRVVLSLAMMGAALGFLPYNRNPATIFMGDAGSMLLGITAAGLLLLFAESNGLRWMLGSAMVFGLPLADMILTLVRRWRHDRPLMQGDRSHYYDQLVDRGWSVKKVVRLSYGIAIFFALAGCAAIVVRVRYLVPLYLLIAAGIVLAVYRLDLVDCKEERIPASAKSAPSLQ
jgi:UDP-GlcNAc:undecaprenyl-phosphate GlcNAc-1-phosphate transferase